MNNLYINLLNKSMVLKSVQSKTTARSLCLKSLYLKMDRLIAGLLRKLRPKSNKLTGLDRSLFY